MKNQKKRDRIKTMSLEKIYDFIMTTQSAIVVGIFIKHL